MEFFTPLFWQGHNNGSAAVLAANKLVCTGDMHDIYKVAVYEQGK